MRLLDLTGKVFGGWTVLRKAPRSGNHTMWLCSCSCGVERNINSQNLRTGKSTSCGCLREAGRPFLAATRDFKGDKNPRARKSVAKNGGAWVPSSSIWYKRAAGVFYAAKKKGVPVRFSNVAALASYVQNIAPAYCPVFGVAFVERGVGFSKWSPSIDKIDPGLGYVPGNIQVISLFANCMKRDATKAELGQFAAWVLRGN